MNAKPLLTFVALSIGMSRPSGSAKPPSVQAQGRKAD
jgi:hypothetical protein